MENALRATNIVKKYGKNEVLHNVSLTIEPGHIYGLLGRNGAGKTTLLSILTAQNSFDEGTITYGDMPVWENEMALSSLCFSRELSATIFTGQNTIKVKEYLRAASIFYPNWDKEYAEKLCKLFGLDTKKKICKLSKGMMSMVTIIIALASRAPITFLDEPVAGLDVVAREMFYSLLLKDYTQTNRTFVVSTHIIEEAASALEKIIIIDEGNIIVDDDTDSLISQYCYISGKDTDIDEICKNFEVVSEDTLGRSKKVCVHQNIERVQAVVAEFDVDISGVPLQKIFVHLTGGTKEVLL